MSTPNLQILTGDCREMLRTLPAESVQCCVTSPPYYGLRDYGHSGQIGLEKTPADYVAELVAVFREVHRVLRKDGTLWLNLGDSYAANWPCNRRSVMGAGSLVNGKREARPSRMGDGLKNKDLIGIPWRVAFALQSDGWYLRSDIIWAKRNCMPESVTDRPTRSHEYIFLMSKSEHYHYDHEAIKEPCLYDVDGTGTASRKARAHEDTKLLPTKERNGIRPGGFKDARKMAGKHQDASTLSGSPHGRHHLGQALPEKERREEKQRGHGRRHDGFNDRWDKMEREELCSGKRNKRDVWTVAPATYAGAHFATFSPELIKPCILAGCPRGGVVLDPFGGSGTTGAVALELERSAILCELNPAYVRLIRQRCEKSRPHWAAPIPQDLPPDDMPLFAETA